MGSTGPMLLTYTAVSITVGLTGTHKTNDQIIKYIYNSRNICVCLPVCVSVWLDYLKNHALCKFEKDIILISCSS